jgi:hypothetical protein
VKNCNNCAHLEWVDGDRDEDSGFTCNKRHHQMWAKGREQELHANLDREEYRARGKTCFEQQEAAGHEQ